MRREDSELLDAVAQYLSVQLAGAFSAMRAQREADLREAASGIRESMMSAGSVDEKSVASALEAAAGVLDASCVQLAEDADEPGRMRATLTERQDVQPCGGPGRGGGRPGGKRGRGAASARGVGARVRAGAGGRAGRGRPWWTPAWWDGTRCFCLVLREADAEPLDDLELKFLERVATDASGLAHGDEVRRQDKHIAQALQTGMRNELQRVPGISADGIYSSATQAAVIGGDFYDLIRLPNDRACVIMGDVSGKGVEAASVSAAVKTALGAYSWQGLAPAHMVRLLNEFLLGFSRLETFATLFVGMVDLRGGRLTYCSARAPAPRFLVRASTGAIEALDVQSGVVGAFHEMTYRNGRVSLGAGDVLLLYTDGTTEARATDGAFFGEDGLRDAVMREAPRGFDGLLGRLLDALDRFTSRHLEDDVAMVALRFDQVGKRQQPRA
jgi:serine phosphatase RsbU (regulator of sigma subunit)